MAKLHPHAEAERRRTVAYIEARAKRLPGRVGPRTARILADNIKAGLHEEER